MKRNPRNWNIRRKIRKTKDNGGKDKSRVDGGRIAFEIIRGKSLPRGRYLAKGGTSR